MPSIKLQSGETAHYTYDPQHDQLTVRLRDDPERVDESVHPLIRRANVRRDSDTGDIVGLRVSGVQEMILEAVIRDLVAQISPVEVEEVTHLEPAGETEADEEPAGKPEADEESADEPEADEEPAGETEADEEPVGEPEADEEPAGEPEADEEPIGEPEADEEPAGETEADEEPAGETEADEDPAGEPSDRRSDTEEAAPQQELAPEPEADREGWSDNERPVIAPDDSSSGRQPRASDAEGEAPAAFAFMDLQPSLSRAIVDMGFEEPTPIQRRAVPEAMSGRDMVGLAQTGTGKTLAFLIPGLQRLLATSDGKHRPRMLVVTPVRELAVQVAEQAEVLARHTDLRVLTVYGGANMKTQSSALKRGVDVIVATPGRLLDHVRRRNADLSSVEVLVLDEADRMLDMGFLPDVREILHCLPSERQTLLFGATMPPAIESLSLQFQRDPVLIEIARQLPPEGIQQLLYPVGKHLKVLLLVHLLTHDEAQHRVLVFTERRTEADLVSRRLRDAGLDVAAMHGDIRQRERERSLERLRDGKVQVLVATNVAARGLDVEGISHVVNYDIPQTVDDYIHRIGRTARADATGTAYTFIAPGDQWMVKRIESALERELPRVEAEGFDYDVPTPSWAQPSPDDVARSLEKPKSAADISRRMRKR